MKTFQWIAKSFILLLFGLTISTFVACNKDDNATPSIKEALVGTWDISSYKLDNFEYMGFIVESASITFDPYTGAKGDFLQEVVFHDEEPLIIEGTYQVEQSGNRVYLNYDNEIIAARISITNGNILLWDSTQDSFPLKIKATRRI